ncbi:MAG: hypothetical protein KY476_24450, partial [Planctomycetes bacterium]|nr:hypothetical protein [Planctomycetota bacterium]
GPQPLAAADLPAAVNPLDLASSFIVNMLEVPGEAQIMIRVRIAELKRSELKRMGINLSRLINDGRHFVSSTMGGSPSTLTGIFENGEATFLLNALAANGVARILSEPTLTVVSGHSASFLSGNEFAVPTVVGVDGVAGQTTTFRGYGTSMIVVPTVIDRDLIRMRIVPEFSALDGTSVGDIPGLISKRVQTTVELREGQTIAIAGLISHQMSSEVSRIPWISEIPWVGPHLFAAKRATLDETELLVLVTPEIVRPMDPEEVPPVPGYEITYPHDDLLFKHAIPEGPPDTQYYQVPPYNGMDPILGIPVPFGNYNPAPATPLYSPLPTDPYGHDPYSPRNRPEGAPPRSMPQPPPRPLPPEPALQEPLPVPGGGHSFDGEPTAPTVIPQRESSQPGDPLSGGPAAEGSQWTTNLREAPDALSPAGEIPQHSAELREIHAPPPAMDIPPLAGGMSPMGTFSDAARVEDPAARMQDPRAAQISGGAEMTGLPIDRAPTTLPHGYRPPLLLGPPSHDSSYDAAPHAGYGFNSQQPPSVQPSATSQPPLNDRPIRDWGAYDPGGLVAPPNARQMPAPPAGQPMEWEGRGDSAVPATPQPGVLPPDRGWSTGRRQATAEESGILPAGYDRNRHLPPRPATELRRQQPQTKFRMYSPSLGGGTNR